ncbi:hypothetical protein COCCADRAFT_110767 [Bipolaris zeicola 26-R-13]|uniref:Thioester reductase (TE) domain-containing protein n=1 Tax=Cochliobolus carbonum (strain 26-R-13) TaxID=930089 RepID=W6Y9L4_COCC2|nr:uncharacterized protein COCCADRAFT_110767 [Bipolaris zeicola 26-R-13]EUC27796.1 hypothetical protein COCCADRAFT_110767 [Bipolaris zeicola 26-R-13]
MAKRIDPESNVQPDSKSDVDWIAETNVPDTIQQSLPSAKPVTVFKPRVIALTGATGFMGQAYLRALLSDPEVQTVHCIAVRLGSARTKQLLSQPASILRHQKVKIYEGDLAEPSFGLDETAITSIFGTANCIIHNGADTSHMKSYPSIRRTNFGSTQEIIKMCLSKNVQRMIPIHYISTGSIWSSSGLDIANETSAAAHPPRRRFSTGYTDLSGRFAYIAPQVSNQTMQRMQGAQKTPKQPHI